MDSRTPAATTQESALLLQVHDIARNYAAISMSTADAEDLAQDIVLRCLHKYRAGKCPTDPKLLVAAVRHMVRQARIDLRRRNQTRLEHEEQFARDTVATKHAWMAPDLSAEEAELIALHERALAHLSDNCRRVFLMVRDLDISYRMVAAELGIPHTLVKRHVAAATHQLRLELTGKGGPMPPSMRQRRRKRRRPSGATRQDENPRGELASNVRTVVFDPALADRTCTDIVQPFAA